jgi:muramoyltetrapeptide carboxypeptidase
MPASELWDVTLPNNDVAQTIAYCQGSNPSGSVSLTQAWNEAGVQHGHLFGGCLSVLTNLIGTPFFPKDLSRTILFWEDVSETPPRILRFYNQWEQSGAMKGVVALILGQFRQGGESSVNYGPAIAAELSRRTKIPIFLSNDFGHCAPNWPLMVGGEALISNMRLQWTKALTL